MRTVGEILKDARTKKGVSIEDASIATKIRPGLLQTLEDNNFGKISEGTIVKGFIKNYAEYLGLSSRDVLAVLRRDFTENKSGQILLRGTYEPLNKKGISWNPKMTFIFGSVVLLGIIILYIFINFSSFFGSPSLKISTPVDNSSIQESFVELKGQTDSDAVVYVNGELITVSTDGNFRDVITLPLGESKIKIEAVSRRGKITTKELFIKRENP